MWTGSSFVVCFYKLHNYLASSFKRFIKNGDRKDEDKNEFLN